MSLEQIFYGLTTAITLLLAVLTLQRLLSGWWRKYYLLGLILVLLIGGVVPPLTSYMNFGNWSLASAQRMYWTLSLIYQGTIFLFMLQLIYRISQELPNRSTLIRGLAFVAIVAAGLSAWSHREMRLNAFMSIFSRDLTFLAAVLNMVLWRFLIQVKKRDMLLLAVSAGLGIQCTGDALGHSLRFLAKEFTTSVPLTDIGNVIMSLTAVATVAIWHTAFARKPAPAGNSAPTRGNESEPVPPSIARRHISG